MTSREVGDPRTTPNSVIPVRQDSEEVKRANNISPSLLHFHLSKTPLVLLTTFSYLPGNVIYHKIALLDKKVRSLLNQSYLLD